MTEDEYKELEELAALNTSGNTSQLIRSLVKRAYLLPSQFGLIGSEQPAAPTPPASTADAMREARMAKLLEQARKAQAEARDADK